VILAALLALMSPTVELDAVGDVMLARWVERRALREGVQTPFRGVAPILRKADLAVGNLECVLGTWPTAVTKHILLRANPKVSQGLGLAGFDLMTLANNHALDCGPEGLRQTKATLRSLGLNSTGTGLVPLVINRKGLRVAFLGACDFHPASGGESGIVYTDDAGLGAALRKAHQVADVVVLMVHWGVERTAMVSERQRHLAREFALAGADVILGSHPHVLQAVEWVPRPGGHRGMVAYSLGNFVFDARPGAESKSAILRVQLERGGAKSFSLVPVNILGSFPRLDRRAVIAHTVASRRS
jgi:poly-gamma-glutamate capsule biosynthesis protein CapA/YwtB (metallophosphatase superfamily)